MNSKKYAFGALIVLVILAASMTGCAGDEAEVATEVEVAEVATAADVAEVATEAEEIEATEEAALLGDPENGRIIYELGPEGVFETTCTSCHRLSDLGDTGPGFEGIADRAATRVSGLSAEEYIRQSIADPEAYIVEGDWLGVVMPTTYAELYSEQDIADLIAFLLTQ